MRKSPITVQQWVDTLPPAHKPQTPPATMHNTQVKSPRQFLNRDLSLQSDDGSSQCSSVESVLELRKRDPETVLMELGFGPPNNAGHVCRIPPRFLQPSKILPEVDFNKFLEQYGQGMPDSSQSFPTSPAKPRPKSY